MDHILLDDFACDLSTQEIAKRLHIESDQDYEDLVNLLEKVIQIAKPKAIYKPVFIEDSDRDFVLLDDQKMLSTLMPKNLKDVHRVFAYIATCGVEVDEWSKTITDMLHNWWLDSIKEYLLRQAINYLEKRVVSDMQLKKIASMSPGSLPDWPLSEQRKLFALLGDVKAIIGVRLTDSMLMLPSKTVSGFFFETDSGYVNCQLCTRENCIGRQQPFDEAKYKKLFR